MKLLITTQVVDRTDPALGFFHRWIEEFAKHCSSIEVICLYEGEHSLPENVRVHSLGKEMHKGRGGLLKRAAYAARFEALIYKLRNDYDEVFVHMNPEYILLGGVFWRLWRKKIALWYLHRSVTLTLRIAALLTNVIFTASPESFRLKSSKVRIVGHGIDIAAFVPRVPTSAAFESPAELRILTTGRIAPAKRVREMLLALDVLHERGVSFEFTIAGGPGTPADVTYARLLQQDIAARPYHVQVKYLGAIPHVRIPKLLVEATVFLNLSTTGSIDKAVLEAFAAGIPAVTSNVAFKDKLQPLGLYVAEVQPDKIADALQLAGMIDAAPLRAYVAHDHSLTTLIPRMLEILSRTTP